MYTKLLDCIVIGIYFNKLLDCRRNTNVNIKPIVNIMHFTQQGYLLETTATSTHRFMIFTPMARTDCLSCEQLIDLPHMAQTFKIKLKLYKSRLLAPEMYQFLFIVSYTLKKSNLIKMFKVVSDFYFKPIFQILNYELCSNLILNILYASYLFNLQYFLNNRSPSCLWLSLVFAQNPNQM